MKITAFDCLATTLPLRFPQNALYANHRQLGMQRSRLVPAALEKSVRLLPSRSAVRIERARLAAIDTQVVRTQPPCRTLSSPNNLRRGHCPSN